MPATKTQTVHFSREDAQDNAGYQDSATDQIAWNAWHVAGSQDANGSWAAYTAPEVKGYKANPAQIAAVTVTPDTVNTTVEINYTKEADTPVPYKPGKDGINDNMNRYVTRTIMIHEPGQEPTVEYQTVHFTNEDAQGNSGYQGPVTGKITYNTNWHVAGDINAVTGTWKEFDAPSIEGYTADPAQIAAKSVDANSADETVVIEYNHNQTDADKYEPQGQNITVNKGAEVPGADTAISNKDDLPAGTKYNWQTTPDTNKVGDQTATVVVTYPDGSQDTVNVTVTVKDNTPKQTDADKYQPQGQDVHVKTGETPNAADGIKNKGDLPKGTNYTWQTTPDTTTPGNKPAMIVVTYPDGSKDEVSVTVHVMNPQTDADKYEPQGQDVHVKTGETPNAADGIKNKGDLPKDTNYTWATTPDTTTPGDKVATVVVTYPDGSKDEVPVTVHVTNPTNPSTPSDADQYQPSYPQAITTPGKTTSVDVQWQGNKKPSTGVTYNITSGTDVPAWVNINHTTGTIIYNVSADQTTATITIPVTVTYPDGTTDQTSSTIVVISGKDHVQDPTTPTDVINNPGNLPKGTTVVWTPGQEPDPSKKGQDQSTSVTVTVPGSDPITIPTHVTYTDNQQPNKPSDDHQTEPNKPSDNHQTDHNHNGKPSDNQQTDQNHNGNATDNNGQQVATDNGTNANQPSAQVSTKVNGSAVSQSNDNSSAKKLPQTGNDKNAAAAAGLGLAMMSALAGLLGRKKREN